MSSSYPPWSSKQDTPRAPANNNNTTSTPTSTSSAASTNSSSGKSANLQDTQDVLFNYSTSRFTIGPDNDGDTLTDDESGHNADDEMGEGTLVGSIRAESYAESYMDGEDGGSLFSIYTSGGPPSDYEGEELEPVRGRGWKNEVGKWLVFITGVLTIFVAMLLVGLLVAGIFAWAFGGL